jgi:hemoglobin/transferrin/lactoferrin receptor protein
MAYGPAARDSAGLRASARTTALSTTALALCLAAAPAAAQDADETFFTALGRIVLGFGVPRVAIDTPQAVTVIDREDLDKEQATTLSDVFTTVPGVQTAGSARISGQAINIRGIGNTEQAASEARIIVTVDGAPKFFEQYRMGSFFGDLELYKQVEILRGPASSTLYGAGAIGGVINFVTRDAGDFLSPGSTTALRFRGEYTSNGDGWLASGIFATRFGENAEFLGALNYSTSGDMVNGAGEVIPGSAYDRWSGLAKGTFFFGNDGDQSIELSFSRTDGTLDDTVVAQTGGEAAVTGFGTADIDTVDDTFILNYSHEGADNPWLDLDVTLSYTNTEVDKTNFSLSRLCAPGLFQVLCDNDASYETTSLRVENTGEWQAGDWQNYLTFGLQAYRQERLATSSRGPLAFHPEGTDERLAAYAQGEFIWNDTLTIIPGLRLEQSRRTPTPTTALAGVGEQTDLLVSPKIAALYQLNDTWGIFGSVSQTERAPTLDELFSTQGPSMGLPARLPSLTLTPETAFTTEIGVTFSRSDLLFDGDALQFKATAFNNDIEDLIGTTPRRRGGPPVPFFSNVRNARIWGGELEGAYESERLFGGIAYSNVRSEDRATGLTLPDTPAENVALTVGTRFPDQGVEVFWRGTWFDDITTSARDTSAPAYDLHDVYLTWTPPQEMLNGFTVNFAVENIFDTEYRNNLEQDDGPGRTFKLTLAKALEW